MMLGGRLAAAIEVLDDIEARHRPAADALRDWGISHRFAGAGDRAAIGNIVFDALRAKSSLAWRMGHDSPRAVALGVLGHLWGMEGEALRVTLAGDRFSPEPLSDDELIRLRTGTLDGAPDHIRADVPEWLWDGFSRSFGEDAVGEGQALATRPPIDLRVNTLKATRERVVGALSRASASATPLSPLGVRIPPPERERRPANVTAELGYAKGWFEVQDEGSQLAALLAGMEVKGQVLDLCAGAGGKTLALSAQMENKGQIFATDAQGARLAPIVERLKRAGTRNVQVVAYDKLADAGLEQRMGLVLVDSPCTGAGVWRRRPDAKWRLGEKALETRIAEQDGVLDEGARFVRPGGRLVYVTCSLLPQENGERIAAFLDRHPDFTPLDLGEAWAALVGGDAARPHPMHPTGLLFSPARTGTDGFYIAALERSA